MHTASFTESRVTSVWLAGFYWSGFNTTSRLCSWRCCPTVQQLDSHNCSLASRRHPLHGFSSLTICMCSKKPAGKEWAHCCLPPRPASDVRLARCVTLSTEVTNEAAQALYETEGWTRQTDFY